MEYEPIKITTELIIAPITAILWYPYEYLELACFPAILLNIKDIVNTNASPKSWTASAIIVAELKNAPAINSIAENKRFMPAAILRFLDSWLWVWLCIVFFIQLLEFQLRLS